MDVLWAILFFVILWIAWFTNILGLPGNWLMLACSVVYWLAMPAESRAGIGTPLLIGLGVLALVGELAELAAGSAGVSKAGGTRRSALYAIGGSIAGAMVGFFVGVPIPVIGSIVGSLLFGSIGAMAGAMLGERSAGRHWRDSLQVGKAAFWGRALGTAAKMAVGLVMILVALFGLIFK
jgi:uncharacterized protein YqgC (DUF456 family)